MPARWLPLIYFALAHLSLSVAFLALATTPASLVGFFYHPRMLAVVHLVTLGWISASILGAVYIIGPLAFRMPLPSGWPDFVAFGGFAIGVLGTVTHLWIDEPAGMPWTAGLAAAAMGYVAVRGIVNLRCSPVPLEARVPMALAFLNVLAAAGLGVLLAVNKVAWILPVTHLDAVFAHAHLAAVGWATLMVVGAGYRILPMILPAAMPRGFWAYAATALIETGVVGLAWAFLAGGRGLLLASATAVAGIGVFLSRIVWMLGNRRPAPSALRRPDWGVAHALQAAIYLLAACGLGLHLAAADRTETTLALVPAYGVAGLLGFLSQMVVGVEARMLPLFAWLWGFSDRGYASQPPSQYAAPVPALQALSFAAWTAGVPLLALGLATSKAPLVSWSASALLIAVLATLANTVTILARLWRRAAKTCEPTSRRPKVPSVGRRGEGWVVAQVVLVALVVLVETLGTRWPRSVASVLFVAGVAIIALGIVLFLAGISALGRSLTPFPKPKEGASLNEGGAYRFVRHPMYGGVLLAIAGWSLARTPIGLAMTAVAVLFLELKSKREEAWLVARYAGYEGYRQRVRWKFLPGLR